METPKSTYRLPKEVLTAMDELVSDPPSIAVDALLGRPRDRTELLKNLIRHAKAVNDEERAKKTKR